MDLTPEQRDNVNKFQQEMNPRMPVSYPELTDQQKAARVKEFNDFVNDPERIKACKEREEKRKAELASDPNNGKLGWWKIWGMRHSALVRAMSALEAVEKAEKAEAVQDWEMPTAEFIGEDLPDVVSL
jgi:hypothetical protein